VRFTIHARERVDEEDVAGVVDEVILQSVEEATHLRTTD
jgi:hypothetical protein